MDFREQVHAEASALLSRLHADRMERVGEAQQALRQALEAAIATADTVAAVPAGLDDELGALAGKIEAAASACVDAATRQTAAELQSAADAARQQLETVQQELEAARQVLETSREDCARLSGELAEARSDLDKAEDAHNAAQAQSQQSALAPLDLLLEAMRRFAVARSVGDALSVLVECLAQDLGRAALFSVQGTRLEGVRQVGFEFASDISKLVVPLGMDSVLSDAVSSGRVQGLLGPGLTARTRALFGGTPSFALVVPVVIKGEALAVVYADDANGTDNDAVRPEGRMKLAELLLCQAVPRLPALLRTQQAVGEHAKHARQLLDRIEQAYATEREDGALQSELRMRIERRLAQAREIHAQAAGRTPEAAAIFDEQLGQLVARHTGSALGRDLTVVTGRTDGDTSTSRGSMSARA